MLNGLAKHSDWAVLFVRLAVGVVLLVHGLGKLFAIGPTAVGIAGFSGMLLGLGVPAAVFFAWVVALVETVGGLFILVGFWTRLSALLIAVDMLVAALLVHIPNGFSLANGGYEFVLVLFLASVSLVFSGAGKKWVLERTLRGK